MKWAFLNGEFVERSNAKVDVEDRGYQFGDGIYEVIRVYNGKMFTEKEHLQRFFRSAESIGLKLASTIEQLTEMLKKLIEKNNLRLGTIYMQATRGVAPRAHAFPPANTAPSLVAYTKELERPHEKLLKGVKALLVEDIRWLRCDIKSLNLLGNILAKQKASENGCYEAIQSRGQEVTEGSSSNVFMVKNGVIITHASDQLILKGITKEVILNICVKNGIPVEERTFTLEELKEAEEVFLSSTTSEVMPVVEINGNQVNGGVPGAITKKLQVLFKAEIVHQCGSLVKIQ
jgi:D-alanine transaminase